MRSFPLALLPLCLFIASGCSDSAVQDPPAGTDLGTPTDAPESSSGGSEAKAGAPVSSASGGGTAMKFAPEDDSAEAAVNAMIKGVSQGHPEVLWDAMPAQYQSDINEVVQTFGKNMNRQAWQQIMDVIGTLHNILDTKAEFILNSESVKGNPNADQIEQALPQVAGLLQSVIDIADLDSLAKFDGQKFLTGPGANLLTQSDAMTKLTDSPSLIDLATSKVTTINADGDTATLEITPPNGEKQESEWVRVDGHWLPKDLASDWDEGMEQARAQLSTLPETMKQSAPQIAMFAGMANSALMQMNAAEDQEQFDAAVQGIMQGFGGMMFGMGGGGFGGPSGFEDEPNSLDDFDSEVETEFDFEPDTEENPSPGSE